ncbi:hypothetical protein GEMRC1_013786 [Eukaryota sp. GEM-RC1]
MLSYIIDVVETGQFPDNCAAAKKINVLDAIRWSKEAWDEVTVTTITKCWQKVGVWNFCPLIGYVINDDFDAEMEELSVNIDRLSLNDSFSAEEYSDPVFEREGGVAMTDEEIVDIMRRRWSAEVDDTDEEDSNVGLIVDEPVQKEDESETISSQEARIMGEKLADFLQKYPQRSDEMNPWKKEEMM